MRDVHHNGSVRTRSAKRRHPENRLDANEEIRPRQSTKTLVLTVSHFNLNVRPAGTLMADQRAAGLHRNSTIAEDTITRPNRGNLHRMPLDIWQVQPYLTRV
jgi:hypothetical protein